MRMTILLLLIISTVLAQSTSSNCMPDFPNYNVCECPTSQDFAVKLRPRFSSGWQISYGQGYKVLRNVKSKETYVLKLCNTQIPSTSFPQDSKFFTIPLQKIAIADMQLMGFVERLGLLPSVAFVKNPDELGSSCALQLASMGNIDSLPLANTTASTNVANTVQAIFTLADNGSGQPNVPVRSNGLNYGGLDPIVVRLPYNLDPNPLSRLEVGLFFLSAFFNLEREALQVWTDIQSQYECASNLIQSTVKMSRKPVVAWIQQSGVSYMTIDYPWKTSILLSAGASAMIAQETVQLMETKKGLLGADILIDDTPGVDTLSDFLKTYNLNSSELNSLWPNPGPEPLQLGDAPYPFLANRQVWKADKLGRQAFENLAQSSPHVILADLIDLMYPTFDPNYSSKYFRNIAQGEPFVGTSSAECSINQSWKVIISSTEGTEDTCPDKAFPNGNPYQEVSTLQGVDNGVSSTSQGMSSTGIIILASVVSALVVLTLVGLIGFIGYKKHWWHKVEDKRMPEDDFGRFMRLEDIPERNQQQAPGNLRV